MASIGSLSLIDPSKGRGAVPLRSGTCWTPSAAHCQCPLALLESSGSSCKVRLLRVYSKRRPLVGLSLDAGEKGKGLRATRKSGSVEGEGDQDEDDEGIADEALRATIQRSKKVLAVQRDILQQIVERRKLVSSIQSNVVNTEQDTNSYDESNSTLINLDASSTGRQRDKKYSGDVSDGYTQLNEAELSGDPPVDINNNIIDQEMEEGITSQVEGALADALGLSREASLEADQFEDVTEASVDNASAESNTALGDRNMNSPPLAGANVMNVILVSAECAPWSKTGGLGDVAGALPKALARRGHRVMVVTPRYGNYTEPQEMGVHKKYKVEGQDMEVSYFHAYIDGVDFVFLDSSIFRNREKDIYGGNRQEIVKRMILFCKAAVEVGWHVPCGGAIYGDGNLVFIANDWHTALLPVYLKAYYRDHGLMKYARCALVIHNIAHQGRGPLEDFRYTELPGHYIDLFKLHDPLGGEHFNIFAAGLKTADRVVTVSHGYAWELKTVEGGWGLHGIINDNDWKFHGIVNGIDTKDWNPELDEHLKSDGYTNYSLETLRTGKPQCKAALQRELGLEVRDDVPLIGFIGRLDGQKGVDIIADAIPWIVSQDVQLVMLGTGRPDLEETLKRLEGQHHDKIRGWVGFSVRMAHRITAGADVILMPSRFEPCGLNQLYAMMFGTIPVVHAVGGLRDTVTQFDPFNETGLGWTFDKAEANRLVDALGHCLNTYRNFKESWDGLQRRGMTQDLSWDKAAQQYEQVLVAAKYQW